MGEVIAGPELSPPPPATVVMVPWALEVAATIGSTQTAKDTILAVVATRCFREQLIHCIVSLPGGLFGAQTHF